MENSRIIIIIMVDSNVLLWRRRRRNFEFIVIKYHGFSNLKKGTPPQIWKIRKRLLHFWRFQVHFYFWWKQKKCKKMKKTGASWKNRPKGEKKHTFFYFILLFFTKFECRGEPKPHLDPCIFTGGSREGSWSENILIKYSDSFAPQAKKIEYVLVW